MQENNYRLRKLLQECVNECSHELQKRKNGIPGESSIDQIESIILPELYQIIEYLENDLSTNKNIKFLLSFAYAFRVWNWDMQKPTRLYLQLLEIDNALRKT
jgi:hypothetical protein